MNKKLFILSILGLLTQVDVSQALGSTSTRMHTTQRTHTEAITHTDFVTSIVKDGELLFTVYEDIYDSTTLYSTATIGVVRKSATTSSTSTLETLVNDVTSSSSSSSPLPVAVTESSIYSAETVTSTIFSATLSASSTVTGSLASSVTINTSLNPLITTASTSTTSKSVTINTSTLTDNVTLTAATTSSGTSTDETTSTSSGTSSSSKSSSKSSSSSSSTTKLTLVEDATTTSTSSSSSSSSSTLSTSSGVSTDASDYTGDLFKVIDSNSPPTVFPSEEMFLSVATNVDNGENPYETNKFYTNMMMGSQDDMVYIYPYAVWWLNDTYHGLAVSHTTSSQYVYGNYSYTTLAGYYYSPVDIGQLVLSATKFEDSVVLNITNMMEFSATVYLANDASSENYIEFPLVEGMGFTTAIYHGDVVAEINSQVGIQSFAQEDSSALAEGILKYRATLYNDVDWLIYVTIPNGYSSSDFEFTSESSYNVQANTAMDGLIIQVAVAPSSSSQDVYYDQAAGMYPVSAAVSGSVTGGSSAEYLITYSTEGSSAGGTTMIFALPHHVDSLTAATSKLATGIALDSTTKGVMYGYLTNSLVMSETLETSMMFLPWVSDMGELSYTSDQLQTIADAANSELSVDIESTVASMDSNYYSGKVIDKYAYILLTVSDIIGDEDTTKSTLEEMKYAFSLFANNTQYYPLFYDTKYKGVTSSAGQASQDTNLDFGGTIYNDHHFHYGYFVHAAAVIGYVDSKFGGTWAQDNKDYVNSLIRDVANPSSDDTYFPVSRMFDWFQGHSWAAGLAASADGKNQESSSEDYNFAYGMKLWGRVIGDQSMESRGDLMLAVSARSMNKYYLYSDDNDVEPSNFTPNKVAGILFDNKIDYTTYFGTNIEYIHGIHMLPITPASSLIRGSTYVKQEWDEVLSSIIDSVSSGWTGILRLNQALYDAATSYSFFSSSSFSSDYLDDGQSLTWCLAFSAGISGAT